MNKNETIADIRKEAEARFRELLEKHVDSLGHIQAMQQFNDVFDRIEAVQKREQSQSWHHREMEELVLRHEKELADARMSSGNAAKIQEALTYLEHVGQTKDGRVHFADIVNVGNAKACLKDALSLLSKPAENDNNGDAVITAGNNAACRSALEEILEKIDKWRTDNVMEHWQYSQLFDIANWAIAKPQRNCDLYGGDYKMLHTAWFDWTGSPSGQNPDGTAKMAFGEWLLASAIKKAGAK